jgi:ParB family chromosome partitioning protein
MTSKANPNATEQLLKYRGDLRAVAARDNLLFLTTVHPEGHPTAVIRLDVDKATYETFQLPAGGVCLLLHGDHFTVGLDNNTLYRGELKGKTLTLLSDALPAQPVAMAPVSGGRLAVVVGSEVRILGAHGAAAQTLPLDEPGAAIAASPDGAWLAVGGAQGRVWVFEAEGKDAFALSESEALHRGQVTAMAFERDELRFYSAGADNRLLLTHARGRLEPEDRGGNGNHTKLVTGLLLGDGDRFYTVSQDQTIKAWQRGSNRRPATTKEGTGAAIGLAIVQLNKRPHLVQACDDASLRLFTLDAEGKVGDDRARIYRGAMAWAKSNVQSKEVKERKDALETLAGWNDTASIDLLAERADADDDHELKVLACQLLGDSGNARAIRHLEKLLRVRQEAVRMKALTGLRKLEGEDSLRPLKLALDVGRGDVGKAAVAALRQLAARDDQAYQLLIEALEKDPYEVRAAALMSLEALHPGESPAADLRGLRARQADIRRLALFRLYKRKMLDLADVRAALRQHGDDGDDGVRQVAFLVSVLSQEKLAEILRSLDPELHRQLHELEQTGAKASEPPKLKPRAVKGLTEEDFAPLLQAMSTRALDTCLRGAWGLALLGDTRAFGTLLQLSRERDASARRETCRALQRLGDRRAIERLRLMLRDSDLAVRDAAFSALAELRSDAPLQVAEAGLAAEHKDVRQRGLQVLIERLRGQKKPGADRDASVGLLARSLNDSFEEVRREAFKAALNMKVGGDEAGTLRFVLQSLHSDVRLEVMTEAQAQIAKDWAWAIVLDMFDDPDADLREDAFEFTLKKSRARRGEILRRALGSAHADLRLRATRALAEKPEGEALELLVTALEDEKSEVRELAIKALMEADVAEPLVAAMGSRHADVRLLAASARATQGDERALEPLVALAAEEEPEGSSAKRIWTERVIAALSGLAQLGHPGALEVAAARLASGDAKTRRAAAQALVWGSRPDNTGALRDALRHQDADVRRAAAAGLAFCGDPVGTSILFDGKGGDFRLPLAAAVALGKGAEDHFIGFLDSSDEAARRRAFLLLMMREAREGDGIPDRCLAALSSAWPRVRLVAARALEVFGDAGAFQDNLLKLFRHRGFDADASDQDPWEIDAQIIVDIADAVTWGSPQLQARAVLLLGALDSKERETFDRRWAVFARRNADALGALRADAAGRAPAEARASAEELRDLVFGAYVGLSRQGRQASDGKVRWTALNRLAAMVRQDKALLGAATSVFVLALRDAHQPVRQLAFDSLRDLGADPAFLASEALSVGQVDVGVMGMKLLTDQGSSKAGQDALERVMLERDDGLEQEAAALLAERRGWVPVLTAALEANSERMRTNAVDGLVERIEGDKAEAGAQDAVLGALGSRYRHVRFLAAARLAVRGEGACLGVLQEMLASDQSREQRDAINALGHLRDERVPAILLDRVDNDPAGTAQLDNITRVVGNFRHPGEVDRLMGWLEDSKRRRFAYNALFFISGYDQRIEDPEDTGNGEWLKRQHPRRDDVLARLLEALHRLSEERLTRILLNGARWAKGAEVDPVLAVVSASPMDAARLEAIAAIGWRLRKRGADPAPLVTALEHPDSSTRFLAAEGLALAGRKEGLSVLMASVELLENLQLRRRAVSALGELADPQALDLLLRLASDSEHALQDAAAEAIGHLADTDRADRIFQLLSGYSKRDNDLGQQALRGLRWFGSASAWGLIRERLKSEHWRTRQVAAEQLGYDPDPHTREVLADFLRSERDNDAAGAAAVSLRRHCGADSLEPDFIFVQAAYGPLEDRTVERIAEGGAAGRILEVLPKIHSHQVGRYREALVQALLARDPLPVTEAAAGLSGADLGVVQVAARILGRAGDGAAPHTAALSAAADTLGGRWRGALETLRTSANTAEVARAGEDLSVVGAALTELVWACSRVGAGAAEVIRLAGVDGPTDRVQPIRRQALVALSGGLGGDAGLAALEAATRGGDPELRALAASGLAALSAERASALVEESLGDTTRLSRLLAAGAPAAALRTGAGSVHYQGAVLPHLVARGDVEGLDAVLSDKQLPEATRLGALEGLARVATEAAEAPIVRFAKDESEEEELRKAAWRALRRARRYRVQREAQEVRA